MTIHLISWNMTVAIGFLGWTFGRRSTIAIGGGFRILC
jgi:hypothetical protein